MVLIAIQVALLLPLALKQASIEKTSQMMDFKLPWQILLYFNLKFWSSVILPIPLCKETLRVRVLASSPIAKWLWKPLHNTRTNSKAVRDCHATLNRVARHNKFANEWVPGDSGTPENENADKLARKGSDTIPITHEPICGISNSYANRRVRKI